MCGTPDGCAPSVMLVVEPTATSSSSTIPVNVFQCVCGSMPFISTKSRSAPSGLATKKRFCGQSSVRSPCSRRVRGRCTVKS